jgi:hypothetical protein
VEGADDPGVTWGEPTSREPDVDDLVVTRWRTHDEDRLYVTTPTGDPVGWVDLETGARLLDRPDLSDRFEVTVAMHVALERSAYHSDAGS